MKIEEMSRGITLIALIVTILILLVLAGISINYLLGENGILAKAKIASEDTLEAQDQENKTLSSYENRIDEMINPTSRESTPTYCNTPANSTTVSTASLANPCVVVETYRSGTQWCRVWSDGWKEQGGLRSGAGTITFIKPFSDTSYTLTGGLLSGTESATYEHMNFKSFTTTTAYFSTYDGYSVRWYACGY